MHPTRLLRVCAVPLALVLLAPLARGQERDTSEEAPLALPADEPLDLSTPEPEDASANGAHPFAGKPAASDWSSRVGIDYRKPSIPGADFQPGPLAAGAIPDQSSGVAWATVTAPGLTSALGLDTAAVETRLDPSQEEGKVGTTLTRSVPVGDEVSVTLQNGVSMTRTLPAVTAHSQSWASSQALRFNILPTDTSFAVGADVSSTDDKWLRNLSAEQKLFGGPFNITGAVSETAEGSLAKSLKAGFKRTW